MKRSSKLPRAAPAVALPAVFSGTLPPNGHDVNFPLLLPPVEETAAHNLVWTTGSNSVMWKGDVALHIIINLRCCIIIFQAQQYLNSVNPSEYLQSGIVRLPRERRGRQRPAASDVSPEVSSRPCAPTSLLVLTVSGKLISFWTNCSLGQASTRCSCYLC